ncbi:MFS transporter [Pelagicoccus mobilis]|uniref:MFS transporter n=1 Tax=Pelagicoccus mobilis TaxID=415221 RepID=A0A934VSJ5_9BACT|nr:MFS transporter [Pelagicoccus mobilis]MBK1878738.1 MFS transporter [Pelagicoccus mobilis]
MQRLSFKEKFGYSMAEIGGSGLWQILSIFLAIYYTDTFGLEAASVATLFLVVRIFDAVNDPMMGIIADRTETKWGKFRPYLLFLAVPFGVLTLALFYGPDLSPQGKLTYAYVTYILMMIVYTAVMIPVSALSGVLSADAKDRTSVNVFRFAAAFGIAMLLQRLLKPSVEFFGNGDETLGFRWTLGIFVVLAIIGFVIAFLSTKERVKPPKTPKGEGRIVDDLKDLAACRSWRTILFVSILLWFFFSVRGGVQIYYFKYYFGDEAAVSAFMFWGTFCTFLGVLSTSWLTRYFEKKSLLIFCLITWGVLCLGFYIVEPGDLVTLYIFQITSSLAGGPSMPLIWSMMGDSADHFEYERRRRATGLVFSASTLAQKFGGALGAAAGLYVLAWYGFEANEEQNEGVLRGMKDMMSWYSTIGFVLCALLALSYPLSRKKMEMIEEELANRKDGASPAGTA